MHCIGSVDLSDLRKARTDKFIMESFSNLLQKKDFGDITITEIVKQAMIHRNTFYQHYIDKCDLLEEFITRQIIDSDLQIDEFKIAPFRNLYNVFMSDAILKTILSRQSTDNEFSSILPKTFANSFVKKNGGNYDILWSLGRFAAVLGWNKLNKHHCSLESDYDYLDHIYQTEKFPHH